MLFDNKQQVKTQFVTVYKTAIRVHSKYFQKTSGDKIF